MDKQLQNLRQSMKNSVYKDLVFSEKHREAVRRDIKQENVVEAVLQLLVQERTGVELRKLITARGFTKFDHREGFLYTLLHQLEQKGYLATRWDDHKLKYYALNQKGQKVLNKVEKSKRAKTLILRKLQGGSLS
ncbi:PadR family transcriptional regulator [Bacillus sp. 03113]|uniref:PadR family transcriptional regulator n=1 Tax=Bacillus sp. 03113 TaxID=2578211 RepID=UPI00114181AC|nr:PadR family transcriptional regulator [Bacillus sp. 03113]